MIEDLDCVFMCSKCHFWACCNSEVIQNDQDMDWSFQENGTISDVYFKRNSILPSKNA